MALKADAGDVGDTDAGMLGMLEMLEMMDSAQDAGNAGLLEMQVRRLFCHACACFVGLLNVHEAFRMSKRGFLTHWALNQSLTEHSDTT